jgi:hypothetical protein
MLALVALAAGTCASSGAETSATTGTLRGSVSAALRPTAGAIVTARAISIRDATTVGSARVRSNASYRFQLPPGPYLVVVEKTGPSAKVATGFGRVTEVRAGRTAVIPPIAPGSATATRKPSSVSRTATSDNSRDTRTAAANVPAIAVRYLSATGPNSYLGRGLSAMLVTDLFGSRCYVLVEWEQRNLILDELRLQRSRLVDPATRVTPRLIQPKYFVEGSLATTASGRSSWSIRVRERATGRIIASDHGSAANLIEAAPDIGARLKKQIEDELCGFPARFSGTFTGENRVAGTNRYTGTITFVRNAGSPAGTVTYRVERVSWRHTFTAETPCRANASTTVTIPKPDARTSVLTIDKQQDGTKGYRYAIAAFFASPEQLTIDVVCNGVPTKLPWVPGAALNTGSDEHTDGEALKGRYESTGTAATYTWNLKGSG